MPDHTTPVPLGRWRPSVSPAPRRPLPRRGVRFLLLTTLVALAGAFIGLLSWYRPLPKPYFVPLWITEYEARGLPVNFLADQDREAVRRGNYFPRTSENAFARQERHLIVQELDALKYRPAAEAVAVYLCAFACCDDQGQVFVLPGDVNLDEPRTRLPLREVLRYQAACPARNKLLVLDIMRPLADAPLGVLTNDVATRVPAEVQAVREELAKSGKDPRSLGLILCACAPGQVSLNSEDLGRSVFSYYFEAGLRGWAEAYDAGHTYDGRISVQDLAAFVRARVDRWAVRNRNTRQTPTLLGDGDNLRLTVLPYGRALPTLPAAALADYPAWLRDGWALHDRWRGDDSFRSVPWLFHRLEASLLRAELQWRGGVDPARIQNDLNLRLQRLQERRAQVLTRPQPEPRSLALAQAQGRQPNPAPAAALQALMVQWQEQVLPLKPDDAAKAQAKLTAEFLSKVKKATAYDLAWAVFDQAASDTYPRPEKIRYLAQLLQDQQPQPRYVETLFLQQLSQLAEQLGPAAWPAETVGRALAVVRQGVQAASRARLFSWVRRPLEEAAQHRYDGEVLLFARGYVPLAAAGQHLKHAADAYDGLLAQEDALRQGQRCLDDALTFLPVYVPYLLRRPHHESSWQAAVQAVGELDAILRVPDGIAELPPAGLLARAEDVRQKTRTLQNYLDDLTQPFTQDRLAQLLTQSKQSDANPGLVRQVQDLLTTPFWKADDRIALWKAGRELARQLDEQTLQLDQDENATGRQTPAPLDPRHEEERQERLQREQAARRARVSIAVLQLGGLAQESLAPLRDGLRRAQATPLDAVPTAWYALARALRQTWTEGLAAQLKRSTNLADQDRLSRIFPAFELASLLDDLATNPTVQLRNREATALWAWLADRYRYQGRDPEGSPFYADAASDYQQFVAVPPEPYALLTGGAAIANLTDANPVATHVLQVTLFTPPGTKVPKVAASVLLADDDWLQVRPDLSELDKLKDSGSQDPFRSFALPLRVALKPGAELSGTPRPKGFFAQVRVNERTYHFRVDVPSLPLAASERLEIVLSADPQQPTNPVLDLRLRPVQARQPFYLYACNGTAKPRNVLAELLVNNALVPGGSAKLTLPPRGCQRVRFGEAAPKPGTALPELAGPLQLRLLDTDNADTVLDAKRVRVDVASPREYVRVTDLVFTPANPPLASRNRLAVRLKAVTPLAAPPCVAELVLPPQRIPGLLAVKDGNFRGVVPGGGGDQLRLYADNLQLAEGVEDEGSFYLNVDGLARAFLFRATFARFGDPTTPREDSQPAVRFRTDPYALSSPNFAVPLEVDNPPPGSTLELSLGRMVDGAMVPDILKKLSPPRNRHLGFSPQGPDGALLLEASIQDWNVPLDTSQILGQRMLLARLLGQDGGEISRFSQTVLLDNSPPDLAEFVSVPAQAKRDVPLTVQAIGGDSESGIKQVNFFVGKPPADGKLPPATPTVPGTLVPGSTTTWTAQLPLPSDKKGPTDLGVQFVNNVGLSAFATATVNLLDALPMLPGRIQGTVLESTRPQAGLEVALRDPKAPKTSEDKAKTMTKADGTFTFENLPPGAYTVSASKAVTKRKADVPVTVQAGQTAVVTVNLLR